MGLTQPHRGGLTDAGRVVSCGTGLLLIGAGLVHVSAAADHEDIALLAVGFLISAYLQVALGGLLIARRPGRLLIGAGVAMTIACVGLWLLSRTVGLQFLGGEPKEPIGFKDAVCVLFEICSLPGLLLLASRDLDRLRLPSAALGRQSLQALGVGVVALFVPAVVFGGHVHPHSHGALASHGAAHGAGHPAGHTSLSLAGAHSAHGASHNAAAHLAAGHQHAPGVPHAAHLSSGHAGHEGHLVAGVHVGHTGHVHQLLAGGQPLHVHQHGGGGGRHPAGHTHPKSGSGGGHQHGQQHAGGGQDHSGHPPGDAAGAGHHHEPEPQPGPIEQLEGQVTQLLPPRR